jgi:hypothetical protein
MKLTSLTQLLAITTAFALSATSFAPNCKLEGSASDNNWNTAGNWDIGVPAEAQMPSSHCPAW